MRDDTILALKEFVDVVEESLVILLTRNNFTKEVVEIRTVSQEIRTKLTAELRKKKV
jgi:hypothetical protein